MSEAQYDQTVDEFNELADLVNTLRLAQTLHRNKPKRIRRAAELRYFQLKYERVRKACRALIDARDIELVLCVLEGELRAALTPDNEEDPKC